MPESVMSISIVILCETTMVSIVRGSEDLSFLFFPKQKVFAPFSVIFRGFLGILLPEKTSGLREAVRHTVASY